MSILKPTDLPEWGTGAGNNIDPGALKKVEGWLFGELAVSGWQNWYMNLVYEWVDFIDRIVDSTVANEIQIGNGNQVHITLKDDDVRLGIDAQEHVKIAPDALTLTDGTDDIIEITPGEALVSDNQSLLVMGEGFDTSVVVNYTTEGDILPDGTYELVLGLYEGSGDNDCYKLSDIKTVFLSNSRGIELWTSIPNDVIDPHYRLFLRVDGGDWYSTSAPRNAIGLTTLGPKYRYKLSLKAPSPTYLYDEKIDSQNATNADIDLDTVVNLPTEDRKPLRLSSNGESSNKVDSNLIVKGLNVEAGSVYVQPVSGTLIASVIARPTPEMGNLEIQDGSPYSFTIGSCRVRLESVYLTKDNSRVPGYSGFGPAFESNVLNVNSTEGIIKFTVPELPPGASAWKITASHSANSDPLAFYEVGYIDKKYIFDGVEDSLYLALNVDTPSAAVIVDHVQVGPDNIGVQLDHYFLKFRNSDWAGGNQSPRSGGNNHMVIFDSQIDYNVKSMTFQPSAADVTRSPDFLFNTNDPSLNYKYNSAFAWVHFEMIQDLNSSSPEYVANILKSHNIRGLGYIPIIGLVNYRPHVQIKFEQEPLSSIPGYTNYLGIERHIMGVANWDNGQEAYANGNPPSLGQVMPSGLGPNLAFVGHSSLGGGSWSPDLEEDNAKGSIVFFAK